MATEVVAEAAAEASPAEGLSWFVMRDLKRPNAKVPAYCQLQQAGFEVFTPMTTRISIRAGKRVREEVPFVRDLLFVHTTRDNLDPIVSRTATLQYRFVKGGRYLEAMTVREAEMQRFIFAVSGVERPRFYKIEEITPSLYGRRIRIVGGRLDGYEGRLVTTRGSRTRRLLITLEGLLAADVEVQPEYIHFLPDE